MEARARPLLGRLSLGALGLALVILVGAAWVTGALFLFVRLGAGSPIPLLRMDGVHVYAGLVGGVLVLGKVARVGFRQRVDGVVGVLLWQRWISWSLLFLYSVVLISGILLLLPIRGRLYGDLEEIHLLTSIWALVPTGWHVWHYRSRALPYLSRVGLRLRRPRFWLGIALVVPVAVLLVALPRSVSQLTELGGGSAWSRTALAGTPLDAIAATPDGRSLLAGGSGLWVSRDGATWSRLRLEPPAAGGPAAIVQSVAPDGGAVVAGTTEGLYYAPTLAGPLTRIAFPGEDVPSVAVDPSDPRSLWAAAASGPMFSADGGATWTGLSAGIETPQLVTAIAWFQGDVFLSDLTGVFELRPGARSWTRVSHETSVIALTSDGRTLYATSPSQGVEAMRGGTWTPLAAPGPTHHHAMGQTQVQLGPVLSYGGRLFVPGTADGVSASADGGSTWTQLGGGATNTPPAQLTAFRGALWGAALDGVYRYQLTPRAPAGTGWWALLVAAALGCGALALLIATPERRFGGST